MAKIQLKIVTPESEVFSGEADEVYVETPDGEIGILPHHTSLMAKVSAGEMRIKNNGKTSYFATGTGLLQMVNNHLSVMADLVSSAEEIDEKVSEEARKRAQEALEHTETDEGYAVAVANLEKALALLKVKRRRHIS